MKKVKVMKCSNSSWWYNHLVGETVTIESKEWKDDYIAVDRYKRNEKNEIMNAGLILKSDCIVLQ